MKGVLDDKSIEIPCEKCGGTTSQTIGWLKTHSDFVCRCGTTVPVDASRFRTKIAGVDKSLAKFRQSIRSFNKRK